MNRRSILLLAASSMLVPKIVRASSPDPMFMHPQMIVLELRIVSSDGKFLKLMPRETMQGHLIEYVQSHFLAASLDIPVFDANTFHQPDDIPSDWILRIECRVDLTSRTSGNNEVVGAAAIVLRRGGGDHLSTEPFSFFLTPENADLILVIESAVQDVLKRALLDPVIKLNGKK